MGQGWIYRKKWHRWLSLGAWPRERARGLTETRKSSSCKTTRASPPSLRSNPATSQTQPSRSPSTRFWNAQSTLAKKSHHLIKKHLLSPIRIQWLPIMKVATIRNARSVSLPLWTNKKAASTTKRSMWWATLPPYPLASSQHWSKRTPPSITSAPTPNVVATWQGAQIKRTHRELTNRLVWVSLTLWAVIRWDRQRRSRLWPGKQPLTDTNKFQRTCSIRWLIRWPE